MPPAQPHSLQAHNCLLRPRCLRSLSLSALAASLVALAIPGSAWAQDLTRPLPDQPMSVPPAPPPATNANEVPVAFAADKVEYAQNSQDVTATGNVVLRRDDQSVRADTVTWNQQSGQIVATGNVRLVDENGNQLFTDRVELTDELKTGAMENLLIALRQGGRLAAVQGRRIENGKVILNKAAYTGCAVEDNDGCPKTPSWRVTANQVVYDEAAERITFKNARLELFDLVKLPLPGLRISTSGGSVGGFLVPDFRVSPSNGIEVSDSYYWQIAKNRDLTGTLYAYSKVAPMVSGQYRALTSKGAYQITGYATSSSRIPISGGTGASDRSFRGYVFANGRFQLDPNWSVTTSIRRASDRTFLRRYDISRDDRLRSMVDVERIDPNSYLSISGWATQTLRRGVDQGQVPLALPLLDYRRRFDDPVLGGKFETQVNTLAISRSDGQDTQRAFAKAQWSLRKLTGMGQEVTLTGLARGDVYHSSDNDLTLTDLYRGQAGWKTRGIATAAVDVRWPLVGSVFGGTQVLTPRVQLVATPKTANLSIPNEDARAIDLEDSNLFALNRFPGYDRIEDGVRFTYGVDWQFERPRWRVKANVGQSVRLSNRESILPDGTGLSNKTSDIVGRTEVRYRDWITVTHRYRVDKDSFAVRRNEIDATVGNSRTYAEIGYTKLNRDIDEVEDLRDREELRFAGRAAFLNYWSLFGSAVVNLTDRSEDPTYGSDGFQPLRTRIGAAYEDDCLQVSLTWRRDYQATGDARKGNSFQLGFALKNIGFK
ncbi:LPS-assembly protein LptD [Novosphingobium sp. 9U]|uniref:LPS-assembly protein LptD n=1 Tax=Novosphingobium sp. 9U TaxID=2653158 RepID=UPI0012EF33F4|nr:LPS assembly protein LptD [Novosphingobium sp. 9U]VWX52165.1 LPS-assembly protein LptD [Novosphingobium sp. 9U]